MLKWVTDYIDYVKNNPQNFNKYIKQNTKLIEKLLTRKDIFYKEADPIAFEKFCRYFKHTEGEMAGQPFILNMEQKYMAACILGIKIFSKRFNQYIRYFTEFDLFVARKWGKDHFIAPLILWFLGMDKEEGAWGQIVAENEKQSKRTFDIVANAIKQKPLNNFFTYKKTEKYIESIYNNGRLDYLSGRNKGKDGSNCSFGVLNECHEVTNFNQYNAIKTSMGARKQPMMLVISSAGITPESLYESLHDRNAKILNKKVFDDNDRIFAMMYGIDEDDDIMDETKWVKGNPAMYEGRPTLDFLKRQFNSMKDDPIMLNTFISKHLNRQIGASIDYFDITDIKNAMGTIKTEDIYDTYAVGGVDLSETTDLCNATALILKPDGKLIILQAYFIAEECLIKNSQRDKQEYSLFENCQSNCEIVRKLLFVTEGAYVNQRAVMDWFVWLRDEYKISFLKIGYDRWMSKQFIELGKELGFEHEQVKKEDDETETRDLGILTGVAQGGYTLSGAIKVAKNLFANNTFVYDKTNKLLVYCFFNLRVKIDTNNNITPHKSKSTGHIDGAVALFDAFIAYDRAKVAYQKITDKIPFMI